MSLKSVGEFGLIRRLTAGLPKMEGGLGVGDDCAVIRIPGPKDLLMTTDMLIEGIHFRRDWSSMLEIGRKAMLVNISDIAAMGGIPRYAVVAVGLPRTLSVKQAEQIFLGIKQICRQAGLRLVGGDTNRAPKLMITVTVLGEVEKGKALTRGGAKVGDFIYVTGSLGDAAVALRRHRHHEPPLRVPVGRFLNRLADSCIDLSDGFLQDLGHILESSRVGAQIHVGCLPGKASLNIRLTGGEDYEILFTVPPRVRVPDKIHGVRVAAVGTITPLKEGIQLVGPMGRQFPLPRRWGYSHF